MLIESSLILAMSNTLGVSLLINSYVKHVMCMFADNGYVKHMSKVKACSLMALSNTLSVSLLINDCMYIRHIKCKLAHILYAFEHDKCKLAH